MGACVGVGSLDNPVSCCPSLREVDRKEAGAPEGSGSRRLHAG